MVTPDERAAIERAATEIAAKFLSATMSLGVVLLPSPATVPGIAADITAELSPLLAAKDARIAEMERILAGEPLATGDRDGASSVR